MAYEVRAIVFDIGGILELDARGGEPAHSFHGMIARWSARLGTDRLEAYLRDTREPGSIGAITTDAWQAGLRRIVPTDQVAELVEDLWRVYLGEWNEELAAYLRALRPRYQTALLSNSFIGAREREEARYRLSELADLIVYSHEEGMEKPDPRIYEITCERLGLAPAQTVFLDDVEPYVEGARAVGMRAVLYRDNAQAMADLAAHLRS